MEPPTLSLERPMKTSIRLFTFVLTCFLSGAAFGNQQPEPPPAQGAEILEGQAPSLPAGSQWKLYAMQTPGAPHLSAKLVAANTVMVSWPSATTNYSLVHNTNRTAVSKDKAPWLKPKEILQDDGTNQFIVINPQQGEYFYRLEKLEQLLNPKNGGGR